jgi:DNA-binding NarL/FixJ family response regulator
MQKNIKTVIADDNTFLIKAIQEKLSFFDSIQIKFTALDGSDLITKLSNNHNIDVILMDIDMPILNGIEATEIVKNKYPILKLLC